jgi:hypothetical protein
MDKDGRLLKKIPLFAKIPSFAKITLSLNKLKTNYKIKM